MDTTPAVEPSMAARRLAYDLEHKVTAGAVIVSVEDAREMLAELANVAIDEYRRGYEDGAPLPRRDDPVHRWLQARRASNPTQDGHAALSGLIAVYGACADQGQPLPVERAQGGDAR